MPRQLGWLTTWNTSRGISLIDALIAFGLLSVTLAGTFSVLSASLHEFRFLNRTAEAQQAAQEISVRINANIHQANRDIYQINGNSIQPKQALCTLCSPQEMAKNDIYLFSSKLIKAFGQVDYLIKIEPQDILVIGFKWQEKFFSDASHIDGCPFQNLKPDEYCLYFKTVLRPST